MAEEALESLIRKRGSVRGRLTSFKNFLTREIDVNNLTQTDFINLEMRTQAFETLLLLFDQHQTQIECLVTEGLDNQYTQRDAFERDFFSVLAQAKKILQDNAHLGRDAEVASFAPPQSGHSISSHGSDDNNSDINIRLPRIELQQFDGKYEQWLSFYDTFNSLIHKNSQLSDIQKFHYLRSALKGEAAQVIQSLEVSASNYQSAWSLLEKRYKNTKLMIHNHIRAIVEMPKIQRESFSQLRQLLDSTQNHLRSLEALGEQIHACSSIIIYLITDKLDINSQKEWESETIQSEESPTLAQLYGFLERRCHLLEKITKSIKAAPKPSQNAHVKASHLANRNKVSNCPTCKEQHQIYSCKKFLSLPVESRITESKKHHLCLNCLRAGHISSVCKSSTCQKCQKRHNTLLHIEKAANSEDNTDNVVSEVPEKVSSSTPTSCHSRVSKNFEQLLATAVIHILDSQGKKHKCRILLDAGSQVNFITTNLCKKLKLSTTKTNIPTFGIGATKNKISETVTATIESRQNDYQATLLFSVMPRITHDMPSNQLDTNLIKIPDGIFLADPDFAQPSSIDLLVGVDIFWELLQPSSFNIPYLHNTLLGFVVSGRIPQNSFRNNTLNNLATQNLSQQLQQFWELENYPVKRQLSIEEQFCESYFLDTVKRDENGRFIVSIPMNGSASDLGESKERTIKRFLALEKRLSNNPSLKAMYSDFMEQYEKLNYMSKVDQSELDTPSFYMPHHGVLKESSLTTRLRVVFNGSFPSSTGVSINDLQMVGPTIQPDLFSILIRFRIPRYVVSADIAKMYNQVLIDPSQRHFQRIVYRRDPSKPLEVYNLNTVTYGTAAASFLAIRCLFYLADEFENSLPQVSKIIRNSMYVDDLLFGSDDIDDASLLCQQISQVLRTGCFELRKWLSNEPRILKNVKDTEISCNVVNLGSNESAKTLGLSWSCHTDSLVFHNNFDQTTCLTKRHVLSAISKIFDPLGLLSPCIIKAKLLIQSIWLENLSWDDPLPDHIAVLWTTLIQDFKSLKDLNIQRHAVCHSQTTLEIHGFSDASERAYGACIFLRSINSDGEVFLNLLCSKTKVAPLKSVSLPRLELLGAQVLCKLMSKVKEVININVDRCCYWTDSQIVLAWINTQPHLLKTFVSNRVAEIQSLSDPSEWRHVPGKENPADLLSRGATPLSLKDSLLWWNGPSFLLNSEKHWPQTYQQADPPEMKCKADACLTIQRASEAKVIAFESFSSIVKLKRIMAWCFRFIYNCSKSKSKVRTGPLTASELHNALFNLVKLCQKEDFSDEISSLSKSKSVNRHSKLLNLNPFLHSDGSLRVGGRLKNSEYNFDKKHPIVISSKHHLTKLLFSYEHLRLFHAGPQLLLSSIRESYWPISGRNLARKTVHQCITCFRAKPKSVYPQMGNLPKQRINQSFPFESVGIDYGGPFLIRDRKGRGSKTTKSYLCLFICLATKAVHLEIASSLTKEDFILALRRFASRRGMPRLIYSDNGTNFVSANSELKEFGRFLNENQSQLTDFFAKHDFNWHFIPPNSPHFGGIYEAAIKSCKFHIKRVLNNQILTFEEFYSVIVQIEGILNSRPLTPLSSDPSDLNPLTPAHFIVGRPMTSVPDPDVTSLPQSRLGQYQLIQKAQQNFWQRWSMEYVSQLQGRNKWQTNQANLKCNDLVLIKDDNAPPLRWQLGRIVQVHPGKGSIPRVASVKTSKGITRRAITRLCPLPINEESTNDSCVDKGA